MYSGATRNVAEKKRWIGRETPASRRPPGEAPRRPAAPAINQFPLGAHYTHYTHCCTKRGLQVSCALCPCPASGLTQHAHFVYSTAGTAVRQAGHSRAFISSIVSLSSPASCISSTMSHPPSSSPLTYTCGEGEAVSCRRSDRAVRRPAGSLLSARLGGGLLLFSTSPPPPHSRPHAPGGRWASC